MASSRGSKRQGGYVRSDGVRTLTKGIRLTEDMEEALAVASFALRRSTNSCIIEAIEDWLVRPDVVASVMTAGDRAQTSYQAAIEKLSGGST